MQIVLQTRRNVCAIRTTANRFAIQMGRTKLYESLPRLLLFTFLLRLNFLQHRF